MNGFINMLQVLSLGPNEKLIVKNIIFMSPLSFTVLFLFIPKFLVVSFIIEVILSVSLSILLVLTGAFLSICCSVATKTYKKEINNVFFFPAYFCFGYTLFCKVIGFGTTNFSFFVRMLYIVYPLAFIIGYCATRSENKIPKDAKENKRDELSEEIDAKDV